MCLNQAARASTVSVSSVDRRRSGKGVDAVKLDDAPMGRIVHGDAGGSIGAVHEETPVKSTSPPVAAIKSKLLPVLTVTPSVKLLLHVFTPLVFWPPNVNWPLVVSLTKMVPFHGTPPLF